MSSSDEQRPQPENAEALDGRPPPHQPGWEEINGSTLMTVASLFASLTFHLGSNMPCGYWQDEMNGHVAGNPIMRDKYPVQYWIFFRACYTSFTISMVMMIFLLIGVPVKSRRIRWLFAAAYSTMILTFIFSLPGTKVVRGLVLWVSIILLLQKVGREVRMASFTE